ncbi:MAG: exosortase/archaeosortase family protein [Candidatus Omnitrophota bacterium]|nr:exosortase/archaeosortase family protein [Candidatus Omnitrophota bacterium]
MTSTAIKLKTFFGKYYQAIAIAFFFLWSYGPVLIWMWDRWFQRDSYYSHGILVPFVSAYLLWQKREELAKIPWTGSPWGIRLILLGAFFYAVNSLFRIYFSSAFSMFVVLFGLILHFFGPRMLRAVLFPLCFLFFMFPLPLVVIVNISFKMKLFAASIATYLLNQMGLYAVQQGSIIKMNSANIIVDDVCSGLRSLISLMALGSIFAYWITGPMYKRILLFLTTIPIAVITNVCRVVFLSTISEIWGPQYTIGLIHDITGYLVFALAFVMFYMLAKLLE